MVVMLCGRLAPISQILYLAADGLYVVVVIDGTGCDASSNSSAATWVLKDSVVCGPLSISGYELIFSRLNFIVRSVFFSLFRYASNSPIFLIV